MDYILLDEKLKFKQKTIIRDSFNNKYPSDHFPVLVEA
jgi:endonuclease/exonuclease/phosphatase family metal-dependent hydrolase